MISEIYIADVFSSGLPVVDVRSPGEFEKGHIPGAFNIPLFSNDERAHVGTVYKQESKEAAIAVGYTYVNPKLENFITESLKVAPFGKIIVHCWRGGMRSRSFAEHLNENGFKEVKIIIGGYKSFRNFVLDELGKPMPLKVLGGYTGSGKTYILEELKKMGEQVVDLEGLAHHKGSAFGAIGQKAQPSVEQFENDLHNELKKLNLNQPVWVEDESHNIGRVKIPMQFFSQMREAMLYFVDISKEERAKFLVEEYAVLDKQMLEKSIVQIKKRLGGLNTKRAVEDLKSGNFYEVALILLQYYDKAYLKGMNTRKSDRVIKIPLPDTNHFENAKIIKKESL
ncbi:MAG: tRNA 2-selenouridine(34) synthase MnmH [Flavobacteriia bacterium]|nr:MAG: tRNA 2-selenouridine(34) synthase MnmH [Flavobacteriia bacterium]